MEPSNFPENPNVSEIKELVTSHIQENRLCRETYLELLQELDKNLDVLNKKLDNITENAVAKVTIQKEEPVATYSLTEHDIIDLSFLPLSNVDDLDDLEEKLSADYDYKQNMVCLHPLIVPINKKSVYRLKLFASLVTFKGTQS